MNNDSTAVQDDTTPLPAPPLRSATNELKRLLRVVREACPEHSAVTFTFDEHLHMHVDVRGREDVTTVEAILPKLEGGLFMDLSRGTTPNHPFFHRVSARLVS